MVPVASVRPDLWCDYCGEPMALQEIAAHKRTDHPALERELRLAGRRIAKLALAVYVAVGSAFFYGIIALNWPVQPWWRVALVTFLGAMMAILLVGEVFADWVKGRVLDATELRCPVCDLRRLRPETRLHIRKSHPEIAIGIRRVNAVSWIGAAALIGLLCSMLASVPLDLVEVAIPLVLVALIPVLALIVGAAYWAGWKLPLEIMRARDSWRPENVPLLRP